MSHVTHDWILPAVPRIVAIGDLHGDMKRLNDVLRSLHILNDRMEWIADPPNTIVVQVGDQIDSKCRDPQCDWEVTPDVRLLFYMDHLDDLARPHGGRVISIIGNHEVMNMIGDFSYVSQNSMEAFAHPKLRYISFQPGGYIAKKYLSKRPLVLKIGNILFCHGGALLPHVFECSDSNLNLFDVNHLFRKYCMQEPLQPYESRILMALVFDVNGIVWTRKYVEFMFQQNVNQLDNDDEWKQFLRMMEGLHCSHVVTGHNTLQEVTMVQNKICFIDTGLSRAFGNDRFQVLEILNNERFHVHRIQYNPS